MYFHQEIGKNEHFNIITTLGFILVFIKIFPRFNDMWIQSTYPNKLLAIEFINGTIGSFIIAFVFVYMI